MDLATPPPRDVSEMTDSRARHCWLVSRRARDAEISVPTAPRAVVHSCCDQLSAATRTPARRTGRPSSAGAAPEQSRRQNLIRRRLWPSASASARSAIWPINWSSATAVRLHFAPIAFDGGISRRIGANSLAPAHAPLATNKTVNWALGYHRAAPDVPDRSSSRHIKRRCRK